MTTIRQCKSQLIGCNATYDVRPAFGQANALLDVYTCGCRGNLCNDKDIWNNEPIGTTVHFEHMLASLKEKVEPPKHIGVFSPQELHGNVMLVPAMLSPKLTRDVPTHL